MYVKKTFGYLAIQSSGGLSFHLHFHRCLNRFRMGEGEKVGRNVSDLLLYCATLVNSRPTLAGLYFLCRFILNSLSLSETGM